MNAFFTETAIIPIISKKYGRIVTAKLIEISQILAATALRSVTLYATHAMQDSILLASVGKYCWIMDILCHQYVLANS